MKTMTCRELGGSCDQRLSAASWNGMVKVMVNHSERSRCSFRVPVRQAKVSDTDSENEYTDVSQFSYRAVLLLWGPMHDSLSGAVFPSVLLPLQF